MLSRDVLRTYEQQSVSRAGYCVGCGVRLKDGEVYACASCENALIHYVDPSFDTTGDDNDQPDPPRYASIPK